MKKILLVNVLLLFTTCLQSNAQKNDTTSGYLNKDKANTLLVKSHKERTIGRILLATGIVSAIAGIIIADHSDNFLDPDPSKLITIGGVAMLGSIPVFIMAGSNKRKANLLLKNETVTWGLKPNLKDPFIAFGFTMRL